MIQSAPMSDAELELAIEEETRKCINAQLGFGIDSEGRRLSALCIDFDLGELALYEQCDVTTLWALAKSGSVLRAVFLEVEFLGTGTKFKICFDESVFTTTFIEWFNLLIQNKGTMALTDSPDPDKGGLSISNVSLDTPKEIIKSLNLKLRDKNGSGNPKRTPLKLSKEVSERIKERKKSIAAREALPSNKARLKIWQDLEIQDLKD